MEPFRGTLALLIALALVGPVGCTGAAQPSSSASQPAQSASPARSASPGAETSDNRLAAACALVAAADGFDPPLGTIAAAFDAGDVDRFGQGADAMGKAVEAFVALTEVRAAELPPALSATFAAAAKAVARDSQLIASVRDGRFSDAELDGFKTAMGDLYRWPPALREQAAKAFPDTGGCGPSPRATEAPELTGSVAMTVDSPVSRTWTGPATCSDPSRDGRIDDVFAEFNEEGETLEFLLALAWEPPVLELNRPGTRVGYLATTQDRSLFAERIATDFSSGAFRLTALPPDAQGGFLQPAQQPLDGTVQWTCSK